ncbi:MAG: hypothetical protein H6711_10220 [Myxococcales bacterium]|nr:hypothetical protein [Myxococcales bacterium]
MAGLGLALGLGLTLALGLGCTSKHPERSCAQEIWAQPLRPGAEVSVIGSWDGWLAPGRPMAAVGDEGWQRVRLADLPPGEHAYLLFEDGVGRPDPRAALSLFWEEQGDMEVSRLEVEDCSAPAIEVDEVVADDAGRLEVHARFLAAEGGPPLAADRLRASLDGAAVAAEADPAEGTIAVVAAGLAAGKHTLVLEAVDEAGGSASARASAWVRPVAASWEGGTIYQVMIDRYRGDGGVLLDPPVDPGARAGGTLDGVTSAIEDGTMERLGVSALWLSPVYLGPDEARLGRGDGHLYTSYHGYWVLEGRRVEPKLGGEAALRRLVTTAHARGLRVLLDIVPNHIYEDNPWAAELAAEDGFNRREPLCVCGNDDCPWGTYIQTCWFTDYLPDLRLKKAAVMAQVVADAVWWTETFDLDGVRIDAVPMMPRAATRRIAHGIRASTWPRDAFFLLGEVYTGPGAWGIDAIRYYLGPDGIDSVFDFPLMWMIRDVIAHRSAGFEDLIEMLDAIDAAVDGSGATLGRFIGNHDTSRFASEIAGDVGEDAWVDPPAQSDDPAVYERQGLALGLSLMLPGVAVVYYGDEVGLAGADDPDSRRVMPAEGALRPAQAALLAQSERLGRLRRCLPAFASPTRATLLASGELLAFRRGDPEDPAPLLVVINAGDEAAAPSLPLAAFGDALVDVVSGERFTPSGGDEPLATPPRTIRALIPEGSPCAADL